MSAISKCMSAPIFLQEPDEQESSSQSRATENWMLVCQRNTDLQPDMRSQEDVNWTQSTQLYPNIQEAPSFVSQQRQLEAEDVHYNSTPR